MRTILIFLTCTLWYASAKPNVCCPSNALIVNETCTNDEDLWITNCPYGAYMIFANEFEINHMDDSIEFLEPAGRKIPSNRYCLGTMPSDEKIAMICFLSEGDEVPEGQMSFLARLICCTISFVCLALTLVVYIMLPNLRDLQGKCMMFTIFSLLMGFFFLALVQYIIEDPGDDGCVVLASLLYFWFMCVFFWLNVVSFNMWRSIVCPRLFSNKNHLFLMYNIYGWGGPIFFLAIVLICHKTPGDHIKPNFGESSCWFSGSAGLRFFFYGPISALLILNIIMFISTAWTLARQHNHTTSDRKHRSHLFKFGLYLKLFIIMGICWVFEPLSELLFTEGSYAWIVTDYINSLQGLIIFLLLVVFRRRVRRDLARRGGFCCRTLPQEWAAMPDEDMDELEEEIDELESSNDNNVINRTL